MDTTSSLRRVPGQIRSPSKNNQRGPVPCSAVGPRPAAPSATKKDENEWEKYEMPGSIFHADHPDDHFFTAYRPKCRAIVQRLPTLPYTSSQCVTQSPKTPMKPHKLSVLGCSCIALPRDICISLHLIRKAPTRDRCVSVGALIDVACTGMTPCWRDNVNCPDRDEVAMKTHCKCPTQNTQIANTGGHTSIFHLPKPSQNRLGITRVI